MDEMLRKDRRRLMGLTETGPTSEPLFVRLRRQMSGRRTFAKIVRDRKKEARPRMEEEAWVDDEVDELFESFGD